MTTATRTALTTAPAPLAARASSGYLPTLDGWRAVAIAGIIIAHSTKLVFEPGGPLANDAMLALTRFGTLGVNVFFGISGFLICSRLLEEETRQGRISLRGFYVRRCFRILPPYLTCLLALGLLSAVGAIAVSPMEWLSSLLFFRNYYAAPANTGWYTAHFWSLAVEEHFYLFWPLALVMLKKRSRGLYAAAGLSLLICAWRFYDFRWRLSFLPATSRTDLLLDGLLWGCVAAILAHDPQSRRLLVRLACPVTWWAAVAAFALVTAMRIPLQPAWQAILIAVMVVGTVVRPDHAAARALETAPARWIGRMSYSLYLWQQLFLVGERTALVPQAHWLQSMPLNIAMTFTLAAVSYYVIEKPAIRAGHRLAKPATAGRLG